MFILREGFLQRELWESFFRGVDPDRYRCFHYSIEGSDAPAVESLLTFANTLNPQYGHVSYVATVLKMLALGLQDPENGKFILLSESCIPLVRFETIFDQVMHDDRTYLYHFQVGSGGEQLITDYPDEETGRDPEKTRLFLDFFGPDAIPWVDGRYREIRDTTGLDRQRFHKFGAQGICFHRDFAQFLIDTKDDLANFEDVRFVEEYYYLCPLKRRDIPFDRYVHRKNLMSVDWYGSRPKTYHELSAELVDQMRGWDFCFLRKVAGDCRIDEDLRAHILEEDRFSRT